MNDINAPKPGKGTTPERARGGRPPSRSGGSINRKIGWEEAYRRQDRDDDAAPLPVPDVLAGICTPRGEQ